MKRLSQISVIAVFGLFAASAIAAPPPNDNFADRIVLSSGTINGTTAEATSEIGDGEPYPGSGDQMTVWYQLNIPAGQKGRLTLTPGSATRDIRLAAYTGTDFNDMVMQHLTTELEGQADKFVFSNTTASVLTMFIQIDSPNAEAGTFQIATAFDTAGPANDNFAARTVLAAGTLNGTCVDATPEVGEIPYAGEAQALSVWYEVTIPAGQNLRFNFVNQTPGADFILAFFTGTDVATLAQHTIVDPDLGASRALNLRNTGASALTYVFAVEPQLAFGTNGSFQIITAFDTNNPANDNLAAATALTSGNIVSGTNVNATTEPTEGTESFATVWYSVTVPAGQQALITVTPTGFDADLKAYTGTTFANLSPEAYGNGVGTGGTEYMVIRNAFVVQRTYRISVDGANQSAGAFNIRADISAIGPANDDIGARQDLDAGNTANGTTVNATPQSGEPTHAGSPAAKSVWYTVAVNPGQQGVFTFTPTGFDLRAAFYDGFFASENTMLVDSVNAAGSGGVETVTIPNYTASSRFLYVAVDSVGGGSGAFTFEFQQQPAPLLNDNFANATTSTATFGNFNADTTSATAEQGEPQINGSSPKSVWFRLTAPQTGKLDLSIGTVSGTTAKFAVFSGSSVGSLTTLADYAETRKVLVTAGQVLHIAVATPAGEQAQAALSYGYSDAFAGEFSLSDTESSAFENDGEVTLTLVRFNGQDGAATVPFTLTPGSATTADYTGTSGQFVFPDDENVAQVTIPIVNDSFSEPDETFTLTLGTPSIGTLGVNRSAIITIFDPEDSGGGGGGTGGNVVNPGAGAFRGIINPSGAAGTVGVLTVKMAATGKFTGKLQYGGKTYPLKGAFNAIFGVNGVIHRAGLPSIGFSLEFVTADSIRASFDDGTGLFSFQAGRLPFSKKNPTPLAGAYTGSIGAAALLGQGGGVAFLGIKPDGKVTIKGTLPDGDPFVVTSALNSANRFGFHAPLYANQGHFSGNVALSGGSRFSGGITWIRPPGLPGYFQATGVSVTAALDVARYAKPAKNSRVLPSLDATGGAATAAFAGLDLTGGALAIGVTVDTRNKVTPLPGDTRALKLAINTATGAVSGSFADTFTPPLAKPFNAKIVGVVDPRTGMITGFFLGPTTPGGFVLTPTP